MIYQNASLVISWLGPEVENLVLALTSIETIGEEIES
jgi:hypothetical protein